MHNTKDTKAALQWISDILKKHHIPFQITGGLAARVYGARRDLEDIDIDIPEDRFDVVENEVKEFVQFGPAQYKSDQWDLLLMTLNYKGQDIDISGAHDTKIRNATTGQWQKLQENFSNVITHDIFGLQLPVISRESLLAYKKVLAREVDLIDIREINEANF